MKNKYIIGAIVIVLLTAVGTKLYFNKISRDKVQAEIAELATYKTPINIYTDHGELYSVAFNNDGSKLILDGQAFHQMRFTQTISGSGARYESMDKQFVLWNKGEQFTLYRDENTIMFVGSTNKEAYTLPGQGK